jgi:hypothetical protein
MPLSLPGSLQLKHGLMPLLRGLSMPKPLTQVRPIEQPQQLFEPLNKLTLEAKPQPNTAQLLMTTETPPTQMRQLLGQLLMRGLHLLRHGLLHANCGRVVQK